MEFCDRVISEPCTVSSEKFWKAVKILLNNGQFINRRIFYSLQLIMFQLKNIDSTDIFKWFISFTNDVVDPNDIEDIKTSIEQSLINLNGKCNMDSSIIKSDDLKDIDYLQSKDNVIYLHFAKLLPRSDKFSQTLQLSLIDIKNNSITQFYHKYCKNGEKENLGFQDPYQITYRNNCISIFVENLESWKGSNLMWLRSSFSPKLLRWIVNEEPRQSGVNGSLKLINLELYTNLYSKLKGKYGMEMVRIWPESTDPLKFVYEDIAIATYLLLLWESEREKLNIKEKQSFLDLGCGNGLLVHILSNEGHPGFGIDLRKRKIWNLYPKTTKLEVQTIIPSSKSLFPETDWLIGNHSDELTPWIPVIAARSSYKCRFFLLPCCAYEFNGKKYQRGNTASSQYSDYMKYIGHVSRMCGFKVDIDRLRIPSTKRICLIGTERTYLLSESDSQDLKIRKMINDRCKDSDNDGAWSSKFTPRDNVEKVKNCTQIDKSLISNIIDIVVKLLLCKMRKIDVFNQEVKKTWNAGGEISLAELAATIGPETMKKLKSEYGGLQTLLKNNSNIFRVDCGRVRFRIPGKDAVGQNKKLRMSSANRKVKFCWFHEKHPDGCPLTENQCNFKH